jgi:RNA polymerase-binding transcription factor DksA
MTRHRVPANRQLQLQGLLESRRSELSRQVRGRIRDVRADGDSDRDVPNGDETAEADVREDIDFALIQMKSEVLLNVDAALRRLEQGSYGDCVDCDGAIAESRLRALPFAVRCRDCEEAREARVAASQRLAAVRKASWTSWP